MSLVQRANLESGSIYKLYAGVGADTDLATDWPGHTAGTSRMMLPRTILYDGGALVVQDEQGNNTTLPAVFAGMALPIAPRKLINAGTAATNILVVW